MNIAKIATEAKKKNWAFDYIGPLLFAAEKYGIDLENDDPDEDFLAVLAEYTAGPTRISLCTDHTYFFVAEIDRLRESEDQEHEFLLDPGIDTYNDDTLRRELEDEVIEFFHACFKPVDDTVKQLELALV